MKTAVVSDLHGDLAGFLGLLRMIGATNREDVKQPGWKIIQLGDLVHNGADYYRDHNILEPALELCDLVLMGNHEYPEFGGRTFGGYDYDPITHHALKSARANGHLLAATSVGDWLLTHAGLHPNYLRAKYGGFKRPASELANELNLRFEKRMEDGSKVNEFDAAGWLRTWGRDRSTGGIFWLDFRELRKGYEDNPACQLKQIVGHTPQQTPVLAGELLYCNDVGAAISGRVSALVTEDEGKTWVTKVYSRNDTFF